MPLSVETARIPYHDRLYGYYLQGIRVSAVKLCMHETANRTNEKRYVLIRASIRVIKRVLSLTSPLLDTTNPRSIQSASTGT